MDHAVTAVYDANVLYPAPLRDLLIRLAQTGLVRARWTEAIHDEWVRNVLENSPALSPRFGRSETWRLMPAAARPRTGPQFPHLSRVPRRRRAIAGPTSLRDVVNRSADRCHEVD